MMKPNDTCPHIRLEDVGRLVDAIGPESTGFELVERDDLPLVLDIDFVGAES